MPTVKFFQAQTWLHECRPFNVGPSWIDDKIGSVRVALATLEGDVTVSFSMRPEDARQLAAMIAETLDEKVNQ